MKRRDFFKNVLFAGVSSALSLNSSKLLAAEKPPLVKKKTPDLIAVMGEEPSVMLRRAFQELGGIGRFVKKGDKVAIKPNIGWDKTPEMAANTNPELIGELVKICLSAGAKEVWVFDHTCDNWQKSYQNSGIESAVKKAGGTMMPANDVSMYRDVNLPRGVALKSVKIHKGILDSDVWFNVPILKNHGGAKMSVSMKNLMGIVWDRQIFHREDLQQCIADCCTLPRKPALNIVDAYRVLKTNGPQGKSIQDVSIAKTLFVSSDFVAVDTAAVTFFNQIRTMPLHEVSHIAKAEALKVGTSNLKNLEVRRIKL